MSKAVYRLRVEYLGGLANIRSVGKNARGSTYALDSQVVVSSAEDDKLAEKDVQPAIDLLCPNQVRVRQ